MRRGGWPRVRALPIRFPRMRGPVLPEAGVPRRRALVRLLRQKFGPQVEIDEPATAEGSR